MKVKPESASKQNPTPRMGYISKIIDHLGGIEDTISRMDFFKSHVIIIN